MLDSEFQGTKNEFAQAGLDYDRLSNELEVFASIGFTLMCQLDADHSVHLSLLPDEALRLADFINARRQLFEDQARAGVASRASIGQPSPATIVSHDAERVPEPIPTNIHAC